MKRIATITTVALLLNLSVAIIYAQQRPVAGSFSGTGTPTTIVLKEGAVATGEYHFDGIATLLGLFRFRGVTASAPAQQPVGSTCAIYGSVVAGGGVFSLPDGSLLMVDSAQGTDCIEFLSTGPVAHCTRTFRVARGTGRLKNASGNTVTFTFTVLPVVFDSSGMNPALSAITDGQLTGTLSAGN
jgi:hypothetical protein